MTFIQSVCVISSYMDTDLSQTNSLPYLHISFVLGNAWGFLGPLVDNYGSYLWCQLMQQSLDLNRQVMSSLQDAWGSLPGKRVTNRYPLDFFHVTALLASDLYALGVQNPFAYQKTSKNQVIWNARWKKKIMGGTLIRLEDIDRVRFAFLNTLKIYLF